MKKISIILLSAFCSFVNAQQGNHLVVQGVNELLDVNVEPYSEAIKKTIFYDIDFNSPEIKVDRINSNRISYNLYDTSTPPLAVFEWKLAQGYLSISNVRGELLAYIFNNILYNKSGDSIDYISQYGGKRGVATLVETSDTFTLYYIGTRNDCNATTFEKQLYPRMGQRFPPYFDDSFYLIEACYIGNAKLSQRIISKFSQYGNHTLLQSNLVLFQNQAKEKKLQFVWNQSLYEINISKNYEVREKRILKENYIDRNWKGNYVWIDYAFSFPAELVVSPSGKWSVFNWGYSHFDQIKSKYEFSNSRVFIIFNEKNMDFKEIIADSGTINKDDVKYFKNAIFTASDSVFIIPENIIDYQGINNGNKYISKLLEVKILSDDIIIKSYDIDLAAKYELNDLNPSLKDIFLAPNGKNYSFVSSYNMKPSMDGENLLFRKYELAELTKNDNYYTIKNPVFVLEGVSLGGLTSYAGEDDKIYFPATPIPYHYINFTNKSLCNDLTYEFTNETDTNWFDHFIWYWGDGDSTASHKAQTVMRHQYKQPGKYRVLLKSITAAGGWVWYSDSVEILPEPIAKYHTENTVGCQWIAVEFADSSMLEKKAHTWSWDFGDGSDSLLSSANNIMPTKRSIQHTYITSGKFEVQLRVSDGRCTDTFSTTQKIEILPAPRPGIAIDMTEGCTPLEVEFGRAYADPTDSTIYEFKPSLRPQNKFMQAQNKATMLDAGKFTLYQKLYGPSGCVTQDSVEILVRQGVSVDYRPELKRSTVVTNESVFTEWKSVPHASKYQLYRNGLPHVVVNDTQFFDKLSTEIDQSYTYEVQAMDSCERRVANKSNVGKTIYLSVKEIEPPSKSEFATALLTWSPYKDWSADGGVGEYESFGNYRVESESWELLDANQDTTINDKDFIKPKNFEKCYYVKARSAQGRYESKSNVSCLKYQATLFAPNAFTPNGDGLNDVFEVFNYGFDRFTMNIYNSWGQKVYEQNNTDGIWAPTESIPQGVYLYHIKAYRNNHEYEFSSTVTLLR